MSKARLLVIDDDAGVCYAIRKSLSSDELDVQLAHSASSGLQALGDGLPDAVLLDLRLNADSGLDVLAEIRRMDSQLPVIIFTAFSTPASTIEATQIGAYDYLLKPVDLEVLKETVGKAIQERRQTEAQRGLSLAVEAQESREATIVGSSPAMQEVYKKIGRFAGSSGNVMILGESGTGKDLTAQALHQHSKRRKGPFVAINCAALSETLLESELFGHERGAFTGADRRRIGKFEYASGGTIFLDEIADMSQATQAKVLRLLQEQQFERLGGNETIRTDVRIVAATNKNLEQMIAAGEFREDLYYRLNVFTIQMPPLRERRSDLPDLFRFFVASFKKDFSKDQVSIDPELMQRLSEYDWPGNMRELQSVIRYALAHATGNHLGLEHLPAQLLQPILRTETPVGSPSWSSYAAELLASGEGRIYERSIKALDQSVLPLVLRHTGGNLQQACELLGISRNTLKSKLRDLDLMVKN